MSEFENNDNLIFDAPKDQPSFIKVIGVGGAGNNAVNHMYRQGITGVDFLVCNTDSKALNSSPVPNKITLGDGRGAGNDPARGTRAAEEAKDAIKEALSTGTKMLFIAAGLGGGTGTGAAPVIARIAKEIELTDSYSSKILVVAIVTTPFSFEGRKRTLQAEKGLEELRKNVDSVLVINNDKLRSKGNMPLTSAYALANDILLTAAKGISELITVNAYVNLDFEDVNAVMSGSGTALMGIGIAKGESRAKDAITMATESELLNDNDISGAKDILLYIAYSDKNPITMDELTDITDFITQLTGDESTNMIWGHGTDDNLDDEIKITLIATGFDSKNNQQKVVTTLDESAPNHTETIAPSPFVTEAINNTAKRLLQLGETPSTTQRNSSCVETLPGRTTFDWSHTSETIETSHSLATELPTPQSFVVHHLDDSEPSDNKSEQTTLTLDEAPMQSMTLHTSDEHVSVQEPTHESISDTAQQSVREYPEPILGSMAKTNQERLESIRRMNEILRNNPNGPELVANMSTEEISGHHIPTTIPLSHSDRPTSYLDSDGIMHSQNSFTEGKAD